MTLLARDEADIVDAQIAFHLNAGVDFVIATDNRSEDGTTEILEGYQRAGYLHLLREDGKDMQQDVWVTRMARLASTEFGADWVINSDADEFWWPRGGTLKEVFAAIPQRFGLVRGCWRHFLPRPDDGSRSFAERMTVRLSVPAFPGAKETVFHAHQKVAHRAAADVQVELGNHNASGAGLEPIRTWFPIEVQHFSFRSVDQLRWKCRGGWWNKPADQITLHQQLLYDAFQAGRLEEYFDSFAITDERLEEGLENGTLAVDTRLRDALRTLRAPGDSGAFVRPTEPGRLTFDRPGVIADGQFAGEASVLVGIDGVLRAEARVGSLEERLAVLEHGPVARLRSRPGRLRGAAVD
jgi:hypothetical protein